MDKKITGFLLILLLLLQYNLWIDDGGLTQVSYLKHENMLLEQRVKQLAERNRSIIADVFDLKHGNEAIEEYARNELGMVKKDELFYRVVTSPAHEK